MSEDLACSYLGKNVIVTCTDGDTVSGVMCIFTDAINNDPEIAEVIIQSNGRMISILLPEISKIDVV